LALIVLIGKVVDVGKIVSLVTLSIRTGGSALNVMLQSGTSDDALKVNTFIDIGDADASGDAVETTTFVTADKSMFGTANVCNVGTAFGQI
jgi:hypothetical protein